MLTPSDAVLVIAGLFVVGIWVIYVVYIHNTPQAKAARARRQELRAEEGRRRAEEERKREEEKKRREREEAEQKARQLVEFRKHHFVVYIRGKDGGKSAFEAVFINALLKTGAAIEPLEEKDGRLLASGNTETLKNGVLAMVGTAWCAEETHVSSSDDEPWISTYKNTYCDYLLLVKDNEGARVIAAGDGNAQNSYWLAGDIVEDLISVVGKMKKELVASSL